MSFLVKSWRKPLPHRVQKPREQTFWYKWSRLVQHRPWPMLVAGVAILGFLTIPLFSIRLGFGDTGNLPETQTARRAYDMVAEGFGPGIGGWTVITVSGPEASDQAALDAFTAQLAATEGVADTPPPVAQQITPDLAMIQLYPTTSPQDEATTELVQRLRDDVIPASGLDARVGGNAAGTIDFSDYIAGRLPYLIGAVLILSFILLMAVFRSLLVPLKAVILNLLSIGAAYGVLVAVFQWGVGKEMIGVDKNGPIEAWIPMMMFAIVFGLSMDYEVFLLSRIKEHYDKTRDNAVAVADGLAVTARVITAAALIMVCVFMSFVIGDDRSLKMFGLGLAVAVAIDATVVRMLLVPATMELLGDRNWWIPKWLDRILPNIDVEGPHEVASRSPRRSASPSPSPASRGDSSPGGSASAGSYRRLRARSASPHAGERTTTHDAHPSRTREHPPLRARRPGASSTACTPRSSISSTRSWPCATSARTRSRSSPRSAGWPPTSPTACISTCRRCPRRCGRRPPTSPPRSAAARSRSASTHARSRRRRRPRSTTSTSTRPPSRR